MSDNCFEDMSGWHRGATFTVELGTLVENGFDIGLDEYPIFDEEYRRGLNTKIVEHFYYREIGQETPELFKRFLNRRMNEVMPYYNLLYESNLRALQHDPFINSDMRTQGLSHSNLTGTSESEQKSTSSSESASTADATSESDARTLVSTTPQMQLSGREDYASNITDTRNTGASHNEGTQTGTADSDVSSTGSNRSNSTEDYITTVSGLNGITSSQALIQWRQTFMNVDLMVIHELDGLFMGIYTDYANFL